MSRGERAREAGVTGRIVSVNVGPVREVESEGKTVRTGIYKSPVAGPVRVGKLNLDGDGQADSQVHGGAAKAVYAYPSEHYAYWREALGLAELGWGAFGENLTTLGLDEAEVRVGDRLRVGTVELEVTKPRFPCFKLGIRFSGADMIQRFLRSGRTGFYLAVVREGRLAAGDAVQVISRADGAETIAAIVARKQAEKGLRT